MKKKKLIKKSKISKIKNVKSVIRPKKFIKKENKILENKVSERTKELAEKNRDINYCPRQRNSTY